MALYIRSFGRGPAVVFFHGWGFDQTIWQPLITDLQKLFTVYLVDLPGFGRSPFLEWEVFKKVLLSELPSQFALVGWSMGGLFATRLAVEESRRVNRLMAIATSPYFIKEDNWPGIEKDVLDNFLSLLIQNPQQVMQQFVALQLQNPFYEPISMFSPSLDALCEGLKIIRTWDLRPALFNLNLPVCYLFGRLDAIIPKATMEVMEKMYPHFKYILFKKSAHVPFLTHPEAFIAELIEFM